MKNTVNILMKLFFLLTCIFFLTAVQGQEVEATEYSTEEPVLQRVYMVEGGGLIQFPRNAFARNIDHALYGVNITGLVQVVKAKPLFAGLGVNFSTVGSFSSPIIRQFDFGQLEEWDSRTGSRIVGFSLFGRYFLDLGTSSFMPFFELQFGSNIFYTSTNLTFPGGDESTTFFESSDWIGSYGGGGGFSIAVSDRVYLTTKVNILIGQSGEYYVKERDFLDNALSTTIEAFDLKQTSTDMIAWNIGLTYTF